MGLWEVMFLAQSYGRASYRYVEMLLTAAVIYWVLSIALEFGQALLERRLRTGQA
jgi:polar amino acid transport system permease protein